jgi:hypothetical protein
MEKKEKIIELSKSNIDAKHICCAISDKKYAESYTLKKEWLKKNLKMDIRFTGSIP